MQDLQADAAVITSDGIIRNPQATQRAIDSDTWDGRRGSYIPIAPSNRPLARAPPRGRSRHRPHHLPGAALAPLA